MNDNSDNIIPFEKPVDDDVKAEREHAQHVEEIGKKLCEIVNGKPLEAVIEALTTELSKAIANAVSVYHEGDEMGAVREISECISMLMGEITVSMMSDRIDDDEPA